MRLHSLFPRAGPLFVVALAGLVCGPAGAATIYTNFGSQQAGYSATAGLVVLHDQQAYASIAQGFVPAANYYLSSIELVVTDLIPSYTDSVTVSLFNDNGGAPGGSPIETFTVNGPLAQFGGNASVIHLNSQTHAFLEAGSEYWIGLQASSGAMLIWNQNVTGASGYAYTDQAGNWGTSNQAQGVFEVDGTSLLVGGLAQSYSGGGVASPEPGPGWMALSGCALIAFGRRKLSDKKEPGPSTR